MRERLLATIWGGAALGLLQVHRRCSLPHGLHPVHAMQKRILHLRMQFCVQCACSQLVVVLRSCIIYLTCFSAVAACLSYALTRL